MNFLLDANIPYSTKQIFEPYGQTRHVRDVDLQTAPDDKIFELAVSHAAILVTKDLEFGNPHIYERDKLQGLIIIRVPFFLQPNKSINCWLDSLAQQILSNYHEP